jgi:hypothetical protein
MTPLVAVRIEIERPTPVERLVIRNDRTTTLTLVGLREPSRLARTTFAPSSRYVIDKPLATVRQRSALGFDVAARGAASEAAAQAAIDELAAALLPVRVMVHVFYEGGLERIWQCSGGGVDATDERDYVNLRDHDPVWAATAPCHPIPVNP